MYTLDSMSTQIQPWSNKYPVAVWVVISESQYSQAYSSEICVPTQMFVLSGRGKSQWYYIQPQLEVRLYST